MIITTQYPIVDCRLFLHNSYKLNKPYFVSPDTENREYIRYFGAMKGRYFQTYHYCVGENTFCNARNALKINSKELSSNGKPVQLRHYENRFYSDGNLMCKFEVKCSYSVSRDNIDDIEKSFIETALESHLSLKADVNNRKGGTSTHKITNAGAPLASLYLHGSTTYQSLSEIRKYWVQAGQPILLVELLYDYLADINLIPADANEITGEWNANNVQIYHYIYEGTPCWILLKKDNSEKTVETCRNLKTTLLRIHAEKQNIIKALEFIAINKDNKEVNTQAAVKFVKRTLEKLLKGKRFNLEQCPLVDIAFKIDDTFSQADYIKLQQVITDINNKYLTEDFDCLFAQIDFDKLSDLYNEQSQKEEGVASELKPIKDMIENKDKLNLKLFLEKNKAVINNCKSSALYDVLKWVAFTAFSIAL